MKITNGMVKDKFVVKHRPIHFIVDELEKINKKDQISLPNLMESGVIAE
jgi:hypothetical protein